MNFIKKISNIFLIVVLLSCSFFAGPIKASGKTLRDLKEEYQKTVDDYNNSQQEEKLTQEEINRTNANIALINSNIAKGQQEIINLNNEINELEKKMAEKDIEIKRIINFLQVSEGENVYLEYAFGAKTFTDFIYRIAVTEQLSNYNSELIKEYNEMIETNKRKKEEISAKEVEMKKQQADLAVQLDKLKSRLGEIYDIYVDLEGSLKIQASVIQMYEVDFKCDLDDDISVCAAGALPSDTAFWRPLQSGSISSEFGTRTFWLNGQLVTDFHTGIDIGVAEGTPVYSTAAGTVVALTHRYHCGGNMVFIHHRVNGQTYTSLYMHLQSISVKVGDMVTKDTVIGLSGGGPSTFAWEKCSTGAHLHFTLLNGRVGTDYGAWTSTFYASLINPRTKVNFPSGYFSNRTTWY